MITYKVMSDEEILRARGFLAEGVYQFKCTGCQERSSKDGHPMLELTLEVKDKFGTIFILKDWLIFYNKMIWKIKHFFDSVGTPELYRGSNTTQDFLDKKGFVNVGRKLANDGNEYPNVRDYVTQLSANKIQESITKKIQQQHQQLSVESNEEFPLEDNNPPW